MQAPWARLDGCAIRHHGAPTVVRSCAVGGAMIQQESSKSPSVSASSNGAALWSVRTVRKPWTYIRAKPPNEPNGWTRPEDTPHPLPYNATPPLSPLQDILWNMAFWEGLSESALRLRPPLPPPSVHHCMAFLPVSVKALEFNTHQYELIPISPCL